MSNEGDSQNPKVRGRHVATEVNHSDETACFAATPPLEAIRLLLSKCSQRAKQTPSLELSFVDITKA